MKKKDILFFTAGLAMGAAIVAVATHDGNARLLKKAKKLLENITHKAAAK